MPYIPQLFACSPWLYSVASTSREPARKYRVPHPPSRCRTASQLLILGVSTIRHRHGWQIIIDGYVIIEEVLQQGRGPRKGEAKDEQAAPALLGPQGPSGEVMSCGMMPLSIRCRDHVDVLPLGKGARGGPAKKARRAKGGNPRECSLSDHRS